MKHTRFVTRKPMAAQSPLGQKMDFIVDIIGQAGDFLGVALDIATSLIGMLLHWPIDGDTE